MPKINCIFSLKRLAQLRRPNYFKGLVERHHCFLVAFSWSPPSCLSRRPTSSVSSPLINIVNQYHTRRNYSSEVLAIQEVTMPEKKVFQRLPADVVPSNYNIRLKPNLKTFVFEGSETINVEVKKETSTIRLNSADITVSEAKFTAEGSDSTLTAVVEYQKDDETVTFTFPSPLQAGKGNLSVVFTGELNDKMKGFYRSKYTGPDGEDRYAAVTQFESTDARRAFPCWDEPAVKATFDVVLVVPKNRVALSNMPVKCENTVEGDQSLKEVLYERSPIMSTYLLAFVVGEYDYVEAKDADGILIRVYTPVGKKEQGQFALDVTVKTLPFYRDYFQIAYPLPKMDLIALADFAAGAMENWGLVTYRETALLVDPEHSSSKARQWVALVVGHEMAHQWFGNLVTMEWWTHLWLNEGFASWIEYLCVDHCFPEFDIWTQFVNADLGRALELDALHTSHAIEVPVGHPDEIDEIFDAISYSKGASVIRMLHDYVGDDDFRKGMNLYLTKFKYRNAFTEDLWEALESASGKPVAAVMTTWTKQMGFPVIKEQCDVEVSADYIIYKMAPKVIYGKNRSKSFFSGIKQLVTERQDGNNRVFDITQEKFNADGKTKEGESSQWMVPISISTAGSPNKPVKTILLDSPSITVTVENVQPSAWCKLNSGTVGVYRVQYPPEMLQSLIPAVQDKTMPPRDRLGLENDLFALTRAGLMSSVEVLKVVEGYSCEEDFTVWSDLSLGLSGIGLMLQYTDGYDAYKSFCRSLYGPISKKLGWEAKEGEGALTAMLRDHVLLKMGRCGDEATITEAKKRFEDHCSGTKTLSADLRSPVYATVLTHGNEDVFNKMLKLYDEADMQEEKVRISRMLGMVQDQVLIQRVLDFAMSEKVRNQDTVFVVAGVTGSVQGRELGWKFVQENWMTFHDRYQGGFLLPRLMKCMTENFVTEEKAVEVETFFSTKPVPASERVLQQSLENIRLNAEWMRRESATVVKYLKDRPAS